jgi:hypothetical protein
VREQKEVNAEDEPDFKKSFLGFCTAQVSPFSRGTIQHQTYLGGHLPSLSVLLGPANYGAL